MSAPRDTHLQAAYVVLRYVKSTVGQGIFYDSSSSLKLSLFSDSDWTAYSNTRRSGSGFCVLLGSLMISWKSKKQQTVSKSSAEAVYNSMANVTCEVMWFLNLFKDLKVSIPKPIFLFCDNQAALHIALNPVQNTSRSIVTLLGKRSTMVFLRCFMFPLRYSLRTCLSNHFYLLASVNSWARWMLEVYIFHFEGEYLHKWKKIRTLLYAAFLISFLFSLRDLNTYK